ncbi:THAP domain-containing protein 5-like isoform X2 [Latimeria chalumnae]
MKKDQSWVPSKYQHLCSEHFASSCFEWRWGIRYLKPDAVPTIFSFSEDVLKRKHAELPRRKTPTKKVKPETKGCTLEAADAVPGPSSKPDETRTFEALAVAIDPSVPSAPVYVETLESPPRVSVIRTLPVALMKGVLPTDAVPVVQVVEPLAAVALAGDSPSGSPRADSLGILSVAPTYESSTSLAVTAGETVPAVPTPLSHAMSCSSAGEMPYEVQATLNLDFSGASIFANEATVAEGVAASNLPTETLLFLPAVPGRSEISQQAALVIENVSIEPLVEASQSFPVVSSVDMPSPAQMVAYFETIPTATVIASGQTISSTQSAVAQDTVLSSALSAPIVSTVPIVSNQAAAVPGHVVLTVEKVREATTEEQQLEALEEQLEEHRYHKNNLSTEQLEAIIVGLQKKVKLLQQRHRRHCAKLEAMETIVEQLKKENLVSEEKLKLLEVACLQSNEAAAEPGSAVAVICRGDDTAVVYTVPQQSSEEDEAIINIEEE